MSQTNRTPKKRPSSKARTRAIDWKPAFLKNLQATGNIRAACLAAKISRATFYEHRKADAAFETQVSEALEDAGDILETEAWRRAVKGVLKPVFQQGSRVGSIREYSDTLLIFLLKGTKPQKYKDRVEATGPNGGPIVTAVREVIVEMPAEPEADQATDGQNAVES